MYYKVPAEFMHQIANFIASNPPVAVFIEMQKFLSNPVNIIEEQPEASDSKEQSKDIKK